MRWILMASLAGLSLAAALGSETNSPAVRPMSLKECVRSALLHNLDLQIERFTPEIARFNLTGSYGAYDPSFKVAVNENYLDEPTKLDPKKPNPDFGYQMRTDSIEPGLSGQLPTGLTYNLGAEFDSLHSRTDFTFSPQDFADFAPNGIRRTNEFLGFAGITLRQPLLKDFWIDSTRERIWVNKKTLKISELALRYKVMSVITKVQLAYFELINANEGVKVQQQALSLAQQLLEETRARVKAGELPPLDAMQAESQVQTAQANVISARQSLAEQEAALKNLVSDDFRSWADVFLTPTDSLLPRVVPLSRMDSWQTALVDRPDYLQAKLDLERRDIMVRYEFNQLFPSLDAVGSYGVRSAQDSLEGVAAEMRDVAHPSYSYGLVFNMPLGNQTARSRYKATRAERQQALLQFKKLEQDILVQVDIAVKAADSHFHRLDATRSARVFAEAALQAEQKKFVNGLSTGFIVLQYQQRLTDARSAELRALADYNKALAQLALTEGATMDKNNLFLDVH
jgi:outer membrane protein TolC